MGPLSAVMAWLNLFVVFYGMFLLVRTAVDVEPPYPA